MTREFRPGGGLGEDAPDPCRPRRDGSWAPRLPNWARLIYAAACMRTGTPTTALEGVPPRELVNSGPKRRQGRERDRQALLVGAPEEGVPRPTTRSREFPRTAALDRGRAARLLGPGGACAGPARRASAPLTWAPTGTCMRQGATHRPGDKDRATAPECRRRSGVGAPRRGQATATPCRPRVPTRVLARTRPVPSGGLTVKLSAVPPREERGSAQELPWARGSSLQLRCTASGETLARAPCPPAGPSRCTFLLDTRKARERAGWRNLVVTWLPLLRPGILGPSSVSFLELWKFRKSSSGV